MGDTLYDRWLLPGLTHLAMSAPPLARHRRRVIRPARGTVLELGFGSGLNLPHYDAARIERLYALEPDARIARLARARIARAPFPVQMLQAGAESIPLPDASVDTITCTWTLCTVPAVEQALAESRRVLRAGGRLLFVEHGLSPQPRMARWQRALSPAWGRCAGGCRLDRRTDALLRAAGFRIEALHAGYLGLPTVLTYLYEGRATR